MFKTSPSLTSLEGFATFPLMETNPLNTISFAMVLLFIIAVYNDVVTTGVWEKVGKLPIREDLKILPNQFIHHKNENPEYELYNTETGEITPSSKEEVKGLECCAVWDSHHVVDRIRCHYNGEPCIWLND